MMNHVLEWRIYEANIMISVLFNLWIFSSGVQLLQSHSYSRLQSDNQNGSSDAHTLMSDVEKLSAFGSSNHSGVFESGTVHLRVNVSRLSEVPEYQIVYLEVEERFDKKHPEHDLLINLRTPEKEFRLKLIKKKDILSPSMTINTREGNKVKQRYVPNHPECLYHGSIEGESESHVALSTCSSEGMMGVLHFSNEQHYVLVPVPQRIRTNGHREHILYLRDGPDDHFCALNHDDSGIGKFATSSTRIRRNDSFQRKKKTIELAVFVDDVYYSLMEKRYPEDPESAILDMVYTLMNAVQLIYSQTSLSVKINFVLVHVNILKSATEGPSKEGGEIKKYLKSFCAWQSSLNKENGEGDHWDHALMLTGLDVFLGNQDNKVVIGLSWVSGMCHHKYSCSINEGINFESVYVISHELGHNLGMQHDGLDNDCDNHTYLMSASLGPGKTSWSSCSDDYLMEFLRNDYAECMDNYVEQTPGMKYRSKTLPGTKYSAFRQCNLSFGRKYRPYIIDEKPFDNICRELWCANGTVARRAHPALDGTKCLPDMVCFHGKCLPEEIVDDELSELYGEDNS